MSATLDEMAWDHCEALCKAPGLERVSTERLKNLMHYHALNEYSLIQLADKLADEKYFLVTLIANDEKGLRDSGRFRLYHVFSHPGADLFLWVSYVLPGNEETYPSLRCSFAGVESFEREIYDLLGLRPRDDSKLRPLKELLSRNHGARLHHGCFPEKLYPLRRERSLAEIKKEVYDHFLKRRVSPLTQRESTIEVDLKTIPDGEMLLSVGPVHAATIESGHFLFHLNGEEVRQLEITLGYKHKGIERLFQEYTIENKLTVQLAEFVSGDSAFSHSLAFCRAVENLTDIEISFPVRVARRLCLELERISNHIGDCAALAHDVGFDVIASDLSMLRERMLELCQLTVGHRLLMGVNRPGGIILPAPVDPLRVGRVVQVIIDEFLLQCQKLGQKGLWKRRTQGVGILEMREAQKLGTTGMVARASGILRDFRLNHPDIAGIYSPPGIQQLLHEKYGQPLFDTLLMPERAEPTESLVQMEPLAIDWQPDQLNGKEPLTKGVPSKRRHILAFFARDRIQDRNDPGGDINARFHERIRQVEISASLVEETLRIWDTNWHEKKYDAQVITSAALRRQSAMGYVESWRGEIVYWLMVDQSGQIYRCKVRDPSMLNWPALEEAVRGKYLSDFPLINKSFNLSYAGNDL